MAVLTGSSANAASPIPLVVDLDGSLLRTNSTLECVLAAVRRQPSALLALPGWLRQGRARAKQALAERAGLDAALLPLNTEVLEHLRREKRLGRRLVLTTGADESIARSVAASLGLFDDVLASDGHINLTARHKRDRLVATFGHRGFDYIGNSRDDLPVWQAARRAVVVSDSPRLIAAAHQVADVETVLVPFRPGAATYLGALRPHHWLKSLLLLVPLLASHRLGDALLWSAAWLGVLSFSLAASGVYLFNDMLDLQADRRHPHKKRRALASGELPLAHALAMFPLLWLAAAAIAAVIGPPFLAALAVYVVLMMAYSLKLKDVPLVDAFVLACGYTLRVEAGSLAVRIDTPAWLLLTSTTLFFGLALLKRHAEFVTRPVGAAPGERVRGYRVSDAGKIASLGIAADAVAMTLLAAYPLLVSNVQRWPWWLGCAMATAWVAHMWTRANRGCIRDDPVAYALRDPTSRMFGALLAVLWAVM